LTFGRKWSYHIYEHCKYRHALRAKHLGSRVFFFLWPSLDGERAGPLANMLFGTKHGGRHHQ